MKKRFKGLTGWMVAVLVLAACTSPTPPAAQATVTPTAIPPTPVVTPTQPAMDQQAVIQQAVNQFALEKFGANSSQVRILSSKPVDWPDTCLGAPQPGEICAQVITPGFRLMVEIQGKTYELHSNGGDEIRMVSLPVPTESSAEGNPAAEAARLWLVDTLKVNPSSIRIVSVTPETWQDGCLGVHKPDTACTSVIVPGYRVILAVDGVKYELRTDTDAKVIVLADPLFEIGKSTFQSLDRPQISWKSGRQPCEMFQMREDKVAYGPCGSVLKNITLSDPDPIKQLVTLIQRYQPFTAQTAAGEISYYGLGKDSATPVQQRALAEWAQMGYTEVSSNAAKNGIGLALTWSRQGGIAGFCDRLEVYRSGLAISTSCKTPTDQPPRTQWLSSDQLAQLYNWLDNYQSADFKQTDPATADAMTTTWAITANGTLQFSNADRQAIQEFAATIYNTQ